MTTWTPLLLPASVNASFLSLPATLIESALTLVEYALYAIEQRITSRDPLALVIVLTGQASDRVQVDRYRIDASEEAVKRLFPAERLVTTVHGLMPITSLSALPSSVSLVQIPSGSFVQHKDALYEAIALRRLGLAGRSALTLAPSQAAMSNFRSMFKLKTFAVLDLITATQSALVLFNLLERPPDGLLCDDTLEGVSYFYEEVAEPLGLMTEQRNDEGLTPATFATLISCVLAAKNRLLILGANPPRDPLCHLRSFSRALSSVTGDAPPYLSADVCRMLANKASSKRDHDLPLTRLLPTHSARPDVTETNELDKLIDLLKKDGCRLSRLWTDSEDVSSGSASDDSAEASGHEQSRKRTRRIFQGVRTTVGKAGRRIGDNLGLGVVNEASKPPLSRQSSYSDLRASSGSRMGRTSALGQSFDSHRPSLRAYRLASEAFLTTSHRVERPTSIKEPLPDGYDVSDEEGVDEPVHARRRHSFNLVEDSGPPFVNSSRRHMELDVHLRSAAVEMRSKERELAELVTSLQIIRDSYDAAIASLVPTFEERTLKLQQAIREAETILARTSQPPPSLVELGGVTNKLRFAQSGAETSLAELEDAVRGLDRVRTRPMQGIVNQSALEKDLAKLQHEKRRVRRLYHVARVWSDWLLRGLWLGGSGQTTSKEPPGETS